MRIAFCHNLKGDDSLEQAEYDTPHTAARIVRALESGGHEVLPVDVSGPLSVVAVRLEAFAPDLIFNTAEGRRGRMREAFFPCLFEHLGIPFTGADGHGCALTLDKALAKRRMAESGVPVLPSVLVTVENRRGPLLGGELAAIFFPVLAKPNFEGSGKGISEKSVFQDPRALLEALDGLLSTFPEGILVEPYVGGRDATVGFLEALEPPVLEPTGYRFHPDHANRFNIYGFHLKNTAPDDAVEAVVPLDLPQALKDDLMRWTGTAARALGMKDLGRVDYRIAGDGRAFFLEANALPSLEEGAGFLRAAELRGLSYDDAILKVVESAVKRWGIQAAPGLPRREKLALVFNLKRLDTQKDDTEAEFDSPKTIAQLREALESLGNEVVELEADGDLPVRLASARPDLVFNIAEGMRGRSREAQVPALCEMLRIPFTGSDAAALAVSLDKSLAKRLLKEAGVPTPRWALIESHQASIPVGLRYPLIAKPNAEGTSKGLGPGSVVDDEKALRTLVAKLLDRYRQPVIVEEYIQGREFTVGLLGYPKPRVLPPMEVVFHGCGDRPVYGYALKQDLCPEVSYRSPAELTPEERARIEDVSLRAFEALGCRDVARVDLRLDPSGAASIIEVNPLPGLTPAFSDLCLITEAMGMAYRDLIAEILSGAKARREALR